jgi:hypothetical protein
MLQYLQPSPTAIQNMLIQQILTSPEQVHWSRNRSICIWYTLTIFPLFILSGRQMTMKPTICVSSYIGNEHYRLLSHFSPSLFLWRLVRRTTNITQDVELWCSLVRTAKKQHTERKGIEGKKINNRVKKTREKNTTNINNNNNNNIILCVCVFLLFHIC